MSKSTTESSLAIVAPAFNEPLIQRTLRALYSQSYNKNVHHYIVDSASTDDTSARIAAFAKHNDDFPLTILREEQKGTGAACDTGFRQAIEDGFKLIARTDTDSVPALSWTQKIHEHFLLSPNTQLLGGRLVALRDRQYRFGDDQILASGIWCARMALSIKHLDHHFLKVIPGANIATRAEAYQSVGGFARTSIDELDEDVDFSVKIARKFGLAAIRLDSGLVVATSMRRIRAQGVLGTAIHHLFPSTRKGAVRIDIREDG